MCQMQPDRRINYCVLNLHFLIIQPPGYILIWRKLLKTSHNAVLIARFKQIGPLIYKILFSNNFLSEEVVRAIVRLIDSSE